MGTQQRNTIALRDDLARDASANQQLVQRVIVFFASLEHEARGKGLTHCIALSPPSLLVSSPRTITYAALCRLRGSTPLVASANYKKLQPRLVERMSMSRRGRLVRSWLLTWRVEHLSSPVPTLRQCDVLRQGVQRQHQDQPSTSTNAN